MYRYTAAGLLSLLLLHSAQAQTAQNQDCVAIGQWVTTKNGEPSAVPQLIKKLARNDVVLLGEDHDNAEHHRWQLHTIAEIYALQPRMALGFEAFPRRVQPILDRWVAGDYTEKEFLQALDWPAIWTYDANLYLPLFHFARMHRLPMIALNVERELVSKVGDKGWENIPEAEREGVTDPAPPSEDYLALLNDIYSRHAGGGHGTAGEDSAADSKPVDVNDPAFRRFVQSQLVWDRAMAEAAKKGLNSPSVDLVVTVTGAGHIIGGYGIPHQLAALGLDDTAPLLPWDGSLDCEQLTPELAYAVFGMNVAQTAEATDRPRLGVFLEPAVGGVKVVKVVDNSVAQASGIKPDDIIVEIAGKNANKVPDIVNAVQATAFGTWLPLSVKRNDQRLELVAKFPAQ